MIYQLLIISIGIVIIAFILYIYITRKNYFSTIASEDLNDIAKKNQSLQNEIDSLQKINKDLQDIKFADDNIFQFIRCINIPQYPICSSTDPTSGGVVCRSKQINCDWFKLVLENNPVAVQRMKMATDKYYQTGKPRNLSELTNPIKNVSWFF